MRRRTDMCNPPHARHRLACGFALISGAMLAGAGCAPCETSLAEGLSATTASVEAVRAAAPSPARATTQTRFTVSAKSGSVSHSPVYFRSDLERPRDSDADFGISGEDLAVWLPEAAKFFISIVLHPIDVVITPPWTKMESDGQQVGRAVPGHRSEHGSG